MQLPDIKTGAKKRNSQTNFVTEQSYSALPPQSLKNKLQDSTAQINPLNYQGKMGSM